VKGKLARFTWAVTVLASLALSVGAGMRWDWWWEPSSRLRRSASSWYSGRSRARPSSSRPDSVGSS